MLRLTFVFVSVFLRALIGVDGLKILGIFPQTYKSHMNFNNAIMTSLAAAGHKVTMISPFPECSGENYTFIDTSKQTSPRIDTYTVNDYSEPDPALVVNYFLQDEELYCQNIMELKEIQDAFNFKEKPFDIIFAEFLTMYPCYTILAQKWNIPVIATITLFQWHYADYAISNPRNPAYVPDEMESNYFYETFLGRLINTKNYLIRVFLWYFKVIPARTKFFNEFSKKFPNFLKYDKVEPSLIFYNGHFSIFSRPMNPNAIDIAGIHMKETNPLPKHLQKFIDESPHGVVLFALGSMVKSSTFSEETKRNLLQAFAVIPQRVIWKFDGKMQNVPNNVLLVKWLPQRDILAHNKTIIFISHCGLSSTYEAIYEAVPVIAISIFIDQHSNSEIIIRNGAGLALDKNSLTKENVQNALMAIINDTRYSENMKELSRRFRDRPMSPQQSVVYWTEYVHRHNGASHFTTAARELNWFQYFLLDVLLFVASIVTLAIFALKLLIKKVIYIFVARLKSQKINFVTKNNKTD